MFQRLLENFKKLFFSSTPKKTVEDVKYSYCSVFYKTKNEPGWLHSYFDGSKEFVFSKLKELKSKNNIFDFKICDEFESSCKFEDLKSLESDAQKTHLLSNWIYWKELEKWFILDDEEIPYPKSQCEISNFFSIHSYFPKDMNEWEDFHDEPEIFSTVNIFIKSKNQKMSSCVRLLKISQDVENFLQNIKEGKFAKLILEEYSFHKFLAWNHEDKIRLLVQDYDSKEVKIIFDVLINKEKFIYTLEKAINHIKKQDEKIVERIKRKL